MWSGFVWFTDAAGIVDRQNIMTLQNSFLSCLEKCITSRYPSPPQRCSHLLIRLTALRAISTKVAEKFLSLSLEGDVKMNALVLEMMNWLINFTVALTLTYSLVVWLHPVLYTHRGIWLNAHSWWNCILLLLKFGQVFSFRNFFLRENCVNPSSSLAC